jgi:hypothetical protein
MPQTVATCIGDWNAPGSPRQEFAAATLHGNGTTAGTALVSVSQGVGSKPVCLISVTAIDAASYQFVSTWQGNRFQGWTRGCDAICEALTGASGGTKASVAQDGALTEGG